MSVGRFRIAARLASVAQEAGRSLSPYRMAPEDIPEAIRREASPSTLASMERYAVAAGWPELGKALVTSKFTAEQEGL